VEAARGIQEHTVQQGTPESTKRAPMSTRSTAVMGVNTGGQQKNIGERELVTSNENHL
jgi:hypothetical protein